MKTNLFALLFFLIAISINSGCSKGDGGGGTYSGGISSGGTGGSGTGGGGGGTSTDTATIILGKWLVIKDSISVYHFTFSDGTIPLPGIYFGTSNDYYLFQNNGTVIIQEGGPQLSSAYQVLPYANLLMSGFGWGNVTILTLDSNNFTWEKAMTSGSVGTYYRRVYFKR